jgi:ribosomal protein L32
MLECSSALNFDYLTIAAASKAKLNRRRSVMWDIFWYLSQQNNINAARAQAEQSGDRAAAAEQRVRELEHRVEQLALACMGMWSLLGARAGLKDDDLRAEMKRIDAMDGITDGRAAHAMVKCPACGRTVSPRQGKCMYCGAACPQSKAF